MLKENASHVNREVEFDVSCTMTPFPGARRRTSALRDESVKEACYLTVHASCGFVMEDDSSAITKETGECVRIS